MNQSVQQEVLDILSRDFLLQIELSDVHDLQQEENLSFIEAVEELRYEEGNDLKSGETVDDRAARISLFLELLDDVEQNPAALATITKRKDIKTIRDAAHDAFPSPGPAMDILRSVLFTKEPTAVISGLLIKGRLVLNEEYAESIMSIFEIFLENNFDLFQHSIDSFCEFYLTGDLFEASKRFRDVLYAFQRLSVVVKEPEDIGALIRAGFTSAQAIARTSFPYFRDIFELSKDLVADPRKIHSHSSTVSLYNEQRIALQYQVTGEINVQNFESPAGAAAPETEVIAAEEVKMEVKEDKSDEIFVEENEDIKLDLLEAERTSSGKEGLFSVPGKSLISSDPNQREGEQKPRRLKDSLKAHNPGASSVLLDMNLPENPDSLSVLSPAAYFVDILQMLKGIYEDSQESNEGGKPQEPENLQTRLLSRRPDLATLQLSKANQDIEIPYIDLANEAMESVAWHFGVSSDKPLVQSFNEEYSDADERNEREPQNVNYEVYSKLISKQKAPLHQFPYNFALESTKCLMKSLRLSRQALLESFCTEDTIVQTGTLGPTNALDVVERIKAAEILGLTHEDFQLFTGKDFSGVTLTDGLTTHGLWGYDDEETMLEVSNSLGLYFVEEQLLPRAGISFEQLVEILQCRYLREELVIYAHDPDGKPQDDAPKLSENFSSYRICNRGSESLNVTSCTRLNFFLRLSKKLGWPVSELDDCLAALVEKGDTLKLDTALILDLAAISEIAQLTKHDRSFLLPIWNQSQSELLPHLLRTELQLARISGLDKSFSDGLKKGSWPAGESLTSHSDIISHCVNLAVEDITRLISLGLVNDSLTWENIGALRKWSIMCDVLKISVTDYNRLSLEGLFSEGLTSTPRATLHFLKRWQCVLADGSADLGMFTPDNEEKNYLLAVDFFKKSFAYLIESGLWPDSVMSSDEVDRIRSKVIKVIPGLLGESISELNSPNLIGIKATTTAVAKCIFDDVNSSNHVNIVGQSTIKGYLCSLNEGSFSFAVDGLMNQKKLQLIIEGKRISLKEASPGNEKRVESNAVPFALGSWSKLEFNGEAQSLMFLDGAKNARFAFLSEATVATLSGLLQDLRIFSAVNKWTAMDKSEIEHFSCRAYRTYQDRLSLLEEIRSYTNLKGKTRGLLPFLSWTSQKSASGVLSEKLQSLTGYPLALIHELVEMNYPKLSENEIRSNFTDCKRIQKFINQADFMAQTGLLKVSPRILLDCVTGEITGSAYKASETLWKSFRSIAASSAQARIALKKANESLRISRRDALIGYLLQQDYVVKAEIRDADGLFEYFLIDVQMGAFQKTTRIMQAISSTQLFVERCLHNMEVNISASNFDRDQWTRWLGSYRKWEASRKVFLYPENLLDPTLRDNKTEIFKELEVSMAQKQLDKGSMLQLVKSYIYGVYDLGSLQFESYCKELLKGDEIRFHFFARTKPSPPKYYYRTVEYRNSGTIAPQWAPWQIMQVDVPTYEVDDLGNALTHPGGYLIPFVWKKQLHLVMPQLVQKSGGEADPASALAVIPTAVKGQEGPKASKTWGRYWELKLSWTIYRDGAWSPKMTTSSALQVQSMAEDGKSLPNPASMVFRVDCKPTSLTIYVERVLVSESRNYNISVGSFVMKGDNLVATSSSAIPSLTDAIAKQLSSPTVKEIAFHKILEKNKQFSQNKSSKPWPGADFAIPPYQETDTVWDTRWTLAHVGAAREDPPQGLVVSIENTLTGASTTWFRIPGTNVTIQGSNADVRMYNVLSLDLIESATTATSLEEIFCTFSKFRKEMELEQLQNIDPTQALSDHDRLVQKKVQFTNWDKTESMNAAYGKQGTMFFKETSTPYAIYNWELGLHIVSLFMERLAATRQYELALEIARLVFDPTVMNQDDEYAQWLFTPFKDSRTRDEGKTYNLLSGLPASKGRIEEIPQSILEWKRSIFSPHTIARNRPSAYMKRLAKQYVQILVDAGDMHFRKGTVEAMSTALQFYVEASHVFGPRPQKIPPVTKSVVMTYEAISKKLDDFSNASVNLELINPFFVPFKERGRAVEKTTDNLGFVKSMYFTIPSNPEITALRSLIDDRLFKIRNSLDLNGQPRIQSLFGDPIDPLRLVQEAAGGGSMSQIAKPLYLSLPRHRFKFLIQKSLDLCGELRGLSAAYLSAKERKDSEKMTVMKMDQEKLVNNLVLQMKVLQREEAIKILDQLQQSREGASVRLAYYRDLTGDDVSIPSEEQPFSLVKQVFSKRSTGHLRMSEEEETELEKAKVAAEWTLLANAMEFSASVLSLIPPISTQAQPWGVGITVSSPPWGQGALIAASIFKGLSVYESEQGSHASRINRLMQQLQERRHQLNQAGQDLKMADKSIIAQRAKIASLDKDIDAHKQGMKNSVETLEYVKSKFNTIDLYNYLDQQTLTAFSHTFNLAFEITRHAREAFQYETGEAFSSGILREQDYWDDAQGGLLCAEKLSMTMRNMELEYLDKSYHDFEIVKHFSLRQIAPLSLLKLRSQGDTNFTLSEEHFDFDFPGHTHRKIKSLSVSVLCTIGPYSSINSVLTLQNSRYRVSDISGSSYEHTGEDDSRFVQHTVQRKCIAISSGQQDPGSFDLDFSGDKYVPFEGEGAISTWNMTFPGFATRQINFDSISDVVIHLRYTSRDGGRVLKNASSEHLQKFIETTQGLDKKGQFGFIDLKHDYTMEWHRLVTGAYNSDTATLDLKNLKERLPLYTKAHDITVSEIFILLKINDGSVAIENAKLNGTEFTKQEAPESLPQGFQCLGIQKQNAKSGINSARENASKNTDINAWPQNDWVLELNCQNSESHDIIEGYLVFNFRCLKSSVGRK